MKKFAALLFILSSTYSFSQEKILDSIYNFKLTNTDIIWQKIYSLNDTTSVNKTKEQLQTDEFTNNLNKVNGNLSGRSNNHGKRLVKNSPYYATWVFDTYLKIEFKSEKFRATANDIIFRGPLLNIYGVQKQQDYPLFVNIVKNNKFKRNKKSLKVLKSLDSILNSKFTLKETSNDNW